MHAAYQEFIEMNEKEMKPINKTCAPLIVF